MVVMKWISVYCVSLFFLLLLSSCADSNNEIDAGLVIRFVDTSKGINESLVKSLKEVNVVCTKDTIASNLPYTFEEAFSKIDQKFADIDTIKTNSETLLYLKALVLSDFVYGSVGFQFLGGRLGMRCDESLVSEFPEMSLKEVYNYTNTNKLALDCGLLTMYYQNLIDSLLNLSFRDTSIQGIHTYPLTKIGNREFIIDPSDPFVLFDLSKNRVLGYREIIQVDSLVFLRTKRLFGRSQLLISKCLFEHLVPHEDDICGNFIQNTRKYLYSKELYSKLIVNNRISYYVEKEFNSFPLSSNQNRFKIENSIGIVSCKINKQTFTQNYLGISISQNENQCVE